MKLRQNKLLVVLACLLSLVCLAGGASANLVTNGGFESGYTGFSTDYTTGTAPLGAAKYGIGDDPRDFHSLWASFNPYEGSNMMIVNAATTANQRVWYQSVLVASNTPYTISFWLASSYSGSPAQLQFSINGSSIGTITASSTTGYWQQFSGSWNSGASTTANLAIVDLNTAAAGNDFVIDDIQFNAVPLPPSVLLLGTGLLVMLRLRRFRKG